jgi:hypothetical protein
MKGKQARASLQDGRAASARYSAALRPDAGGAAGIRLAGACCAACGLVRASKPDRQAGPH